MLKYNIDYEIMGMLVTIVIAIAFRMNYVSRTRSDKAFMKLIYFILGSQALDMITAFTISMVDPKLNAFNLIMTTGYFYCAFATAVAFERYVASYILDIKRSRFYNYLRYFIVIGYCIHGLLNPWTKLAFYFLPDGTYLHGDLYFIGYIAPGLFEVLALYQIIRYRDHFSKKQWISSVAFLGAVAVAMVLQAFVVNDVYLTFGLIPVALLMILFSLETPDYRKLTQTLEELEAAKQEALRANRVKSDFLANMSHEIRTPINAVLGFDEMILRESKEKEVIEYAKNIKSSGHTLLVLVNDILDLSKIEAGKMEVVLAEYDVVESLSNLLKVIESRASEKGLKFVCDIDGNIPRKLIGDEVRITQVLSNLLTNAVKYTQKGTVTLQIQVKECKRDEITLYFAVKDTGIGIREEDKEKLFSEFGRVEDGVTHRIEGTGLGLPITMKCLRLMGSTIELESVYGEGSVFHFLLRQRIAEGTPLGDFEKSRMEAEDQVAVSREDFTAPDAKILVVDDVELNLKVFQGLLKKSLIQIDTADSGAKAIEMIKEKTYDCIFMDHQMPEMDGIETLERLRQDKDAILGQTPVIALTANAIAGARETYLQKGFSDYLTKPIDGFALLAMLHKWLPQEKLCAVSEEEADEVMEFLPAGQVEETKQGSLKKGHTMVFERLRQKGIDVEAGLTYAMGEEDFYLDMLKDFVAAAESTGRELRKYYEKRDWQNYQIKVHALKGTAKMIGAQKLSEDAKRMESAAKAQEEATIMEGQDAFMEHYDLVVKEIAGSI